MDKEWVHLNRASPEYIQEAWNFVNMAEKNSGNAENVLCPCKDCRNLSHRRYHEIFEHLVIAGMDPTYTDWFHHGEQPLEDDEAEEIYTTDEYNLYRAANCHDEDYVFPVGGTQGDDFSEQIKDAETPLYPNCTKYSKLSAIMSLYKMKGENGWPDKSFDELLEKVHDMLPMGNVLLRSFNEVKKFLKSFGIGYKKIHACMNDCCLFRKEYEHLGNCPKCGCSRWKVDEHTKKPRKGVPAKVLRYFPIVSRFRRLFRSQQKAKDLRWHFSHKSNNGKMRHPVDSVSWDLVNDKWPSFAKDPRNLRLGLATDGFNPFSNLSKSYSCWPVMLVTYNFPPWLCMKSENIMLALLIPGKKEPGNDIDVYLQPLIEDLQLLWDIGVDVYDAFSKIIFNLRAIVMWTINDFPAYGNLAGCPTQGRAACPMCGKNTHHRYLRFSKKTSYMGHRRFLPPTHPYRKKNLGLMAMRNMEEILES